MDVTIDLSNVEIETERLFLRPWQLSDLEDLYVYASVPGVGEMAGWPHHTSIETSKRILDMFIEEKTVLAVFHKADQKVIGSIGFHKSWGNDDPEIKHLKLKDIGYVLSKSYWGEGLMPEAVKALIDYAFNLEWVDAFTIGHFLSNPQSRRVIEKCGFQFVRQSEYYTSQLDQTFEDMKYIIKRASKDELIDFAWRLSQQDSTASYPRLKSKEEVETVINRAESRSNQRCLTSYRGGALNGICVYYWVEDEKYAQTSMLLIEHDFDIVADAFFKEISSELKGYSLLVGFPEGHKSAHEHMPGMDFNCIESSVVTEIVSWTKCDVQPPSMQSGVSSILFELSSDELERYAAFHDKHATALEMFYTSKNIAKELDRFRIFVYQVGDDIKGSIFVKCFEPSAEVFGLFIDEDVRHLELEKGLIQTMLNALDSIEDIMYFIDESSSNELEAALYAGFKIKEKYKCYKKMI